MLRFLWLSEMVTTVLGCSQEPAGATPGGLFQSAPWVGDGAQPAEKVWRGTGTQLGPPLKLDLLGETVFPLEFAISHERWRESLSKNLIPFGSKTAASTVLMSASK